nr:MAG TPA: hypothetical protein [Caudoviricetes sp.]
MRFSKFSFKSLFKIFSFKHKRNVKHSFYAFCYYGKLYTS